MGPFYLFVKLMIKQAARFLSILFLLSLFVVAFAQAEEVKTDLLKIDGIA